MRLSPLLLLLLPTLATAVERRGEVVFEGEAPPFAALESAILASDPAVAEGYHARTGLYLFVADEAAWDAHADALAAALAQSPEAVAAFATALPPDVAWAGPDIEGGILRFSLPDGRGEGAVAVRLPPLLVRGKPDERLLGSDPPNRGSYVAGVSVERADGSTLASLYLPGRPKGITRGRPPAVEPRPLPGDGRGDLAIFGGRGGSGSDGREHRQRLEELAGKRLPLRAFLGFPKGREDLARELRSIRVDAEVPVFEGGPYRALAAPADTWRFETRKISHPTRYTAFSAPIAAGDGQGGTAGLSLVGVALYTPLLLGPEAAATWAGVPAPEFFGAVQRGELPFLRDRDAIWFARADVDRWKAGEARTGEGDALARKEAAERVERLAERSRRLGKAAQAPQPTRYVPRDDAEPDGAAVRGRVFERDLLAWLQHHDRKAELGPPPARTAAPAAGGAGFSAALRLGARSRAPSASRGSGSGALLEITNLYTLQPSCLPGEPVLGVVEFVVDRIPGDEAAKLELKWALGFGEKALVRLATDVEREAGEHEVVFEVGCPSGSGDATLDVLLVWEAEGREQAKQAKVPVRP